MKIRCICCGHNLELGYAYDDYEGEIRCWVCGGILEIRMRDGFLTSSKRIIAPAPMAEDTIERALE